MRGEWCYFRQYFNKQTCDDIVNKGLQFPAKDAKLGVEGEFQNEEIRRSKIRFINHDQNEFNYVFEELWKLAIKANGDFFNFHISRLNYIQLAEYSHEYKGEYKDHHDVFWLNNDPFYHRKLTCVIQLSDPLTYEGGDFEVLDTIEKPNKEHLREQGTVVFIPSFLIHRATPVTAGTRYSIAAWFEGPKWR